MNAKRIITTRLAKSVALLLCCFAIVSCANERLTPEQRYNKAPKFIQELALIDGADTLEPVRIQVYAESLFVSYRNLHRLDVYTLTGELVRKINLVDPEVVYPSSFVVLDSELVVVDHSRKMIVMYNREGKYINSFGLLPDHKTSLAPFAITEYGGVLYVTDLSLRKIIAISNTDAEGITEKGEMILSFPNDTLSTLEFPSATFVTLDGRLLVGDAGDGDVEVFTCDGRHIYSFESFPQEKRMAPQAFASDNLVDPSLVDTSKFDPSNIAQVGRIHVVDGNNAKVHIYNPLGQHIVSYPTGSIMDKPTGIAVELWTKNIYITDPVKKRVYVYNYGS